MILLCICIVFTLVFFTITSIDLAMSFVFVITYPYRTDLKDIAKAFSISKFAGIICVMGYFYAGIISEYVRRRGDILRHSIGFVSANALATCVAFSTLGYLYFRIKNWALWDSIILFAVDIFIYKQTNSRMACLVILIVSIIGLTSKTLQSNNLAKALYFASSWLYIVFTILVGLMVFWFSTRTNSILYNIVNITVSDRLRNAIQYVNMYGIKILGQNIRTVTAREAALSGTSWSGIDCSYLMIFIRYGILAGLGFAILYFWLGKKLKERSDLIGAIIVVIILCFSLTENCLYQIQNNFTLFILASEIYKRNVSVSSGG